MTHLNVEVVSRVLRRKQLQTLLGLSCSSIYSKMSVKSKYYDPDFPRPIHIGKSAVGWLESEVKDYLDVLSDRRHSVDIDSFLPKK